MRRLLMLFVDGLGLVPPTHPHTLIHRGAYPSLVRLLDDAEPIDACLGVDGLPQSATGQATMLTGINVPARVGRHVEGFPGPVIRELIVQSNIYHHCRHAGIPATFANAYLADSLEQVKAMRRQSVTTVAALSGLGCVRLKHDMLAHRAVCHDLTRRTLVERGYDGPMISPAEAADDLCAIATAHRFTLFEHFLTDRAGHTADPVVVGGALTCLDAFVARLLEGVRRRDITLVLTSDHGNIEDMSTSTHTTNPVPWAVCGADADGLRQNVHDLTDIASAIIRFLTDE